MNLLESLDDTSYQRFCGKQNLDKALTTLKGILTGISMDGRITVAEQDELRTWCETHRICSRWNPFNELIPKVDAALSDGVLDNEEVDDLLWFLDAAGAGSAYYDAVTSDLQFLQGMLHGALADGVIDEREVKSISDWLNDNLHLQGCWPFDEIHGTITGILADNLVDEDEAEHLKLFFSEFAALSSGRKMALDPQKRLQMSVCGVCAVDPVIEFSRNAFCFTGQSARAKRSEFKRLVEEADGIFLPSVTNELKYLIYGAAGNQCWAYSCYGRKVERVVEMRKAGAGCMIVHENDFWDALEDM